jgi:hypothetical protein
MFKFNLTHLSEAELRRVMEDLLEAAHAADEAGEAFQAQFTSYDRTVLCRTSQEARAFREGFIMSRISSFQRVADEPWKYVNVSDPDLLH